MATTTNTPTLRNSQVTFDLDTLRTAAVNYSKSYSCKVLLQHVSAQKYIAFTRLIKYQINSRYVDQLNYCTLSLHTI
jgi:hypothetical protein